MTDPTADAAKLLPDGLTEADRPIFEIVSRYLRDVVHDITYLEDRAVEIIQLVRANMRPQPAPLSVIHESGSIAPETWHGLAQKYGDTTQPAPPAAEPDFGKITMEWAFIEQRRQTPMHSSAYLVCHEHLTEFAQRMYRLGLAARPKVEDAVLPKGLVDALRRQRQIDEDGEEVAVNRQACDEAATLLERLVKERDEARAILQNAKRIECDVCEKRIDLTNAVYEWSTKHREAQTNLAEREAELANAAVLLTNKISKTHVALTDSPGRKKNITDWLERHAARQQQKASAEPSSG